MSHRKIEEPRQPVTPLIPYSDKSETPEPAQGLPNRKLNPHPNPFTHIASKTVDDSEVNTSFKAQKHALEKLGFELSELKRDARRLRRKTLLTQITELEQSIKAGSVEHTLTLLKTFELAALQHHIPVLEPLTSSEHSSDHITIDIEPEDIEPAANDSLPENVDDEEDIPDIPASMQTRPVQYFHHGKLNLVRGDITRLQTDHDIQVDAIISPAGGMGNLTTARDQVLAVETSMATEEFQGALDRLESGSSALMPALALVDQGVKHILHPITPRPGDQEAHNLLLTSYVTSISKAVEKGAASIALPVIGDERVGLSVDNAGKLALGAVMHCLTAIPEGKTRPKIYFVFPDTTESQPRLESMQQKLENLPDKLLASRIGNNPLQLPMLRLGEKDTLRLMSKLLPSGHAFTTRGKIKWMNKEVEQLCKMMYRGEFDLKRYDHLHTYLHNVQMKIYSQAEAGNITPAESMLLVNFFETRTEMLEIYERKHSKIISRKPMTKNVEKYNAESHFASCPTPVKIAFLNHFDQYCEEAFRAHHLKAIPAGQSTRPEKPSGKINRPVHGVMSAARTALWVKTLIHLYQKHGNGEAESIRDEEIPLIQMAAIYHNSSAHAERSQRELKSAQHCKQALLKEGVDEATAEQISSAISGKSKAYGEQSKSIIEKVLHDAVALEKLRHCETFDLDQELDFAKEFSDRGMAITDIEKVSQEAAKTIHRQKDMMRAPVITLKGTAVSPSPSASFNATEKQKWEHAEHPYSALELSVEHHSKFLDELINDS